MDEPPDDFHARVARMNEALRAVLVRERLAAGLRQHEFARAVGLSQATISKMEKGIRSIGAGELVEFARVLRADPLALLSKAMARADLPQQRGALIERIRRIAQACASGKDHGQQCPCEGRLAGQPHSRRWVERKATAVNRPEFEPPARTLPF